RGGTWNSGAGQPDIAQSERDGLLRESSVNSWTSIVPGAGSSGTYFPKYEYLAGQNFSNRPGWNSIVPSLNYNAGVTFHRRGENNPSNTVAAEYLVKNSNTAATKIFDKEVPDRVTMIMAMIPEINPNDDATYMLGFGRGNEPGYEATGLMDPLIGVNAQPNGTRSFRYAEYGMAHNDQNANGDGVVGVQSMFDPNSTLIMSYYLRYNYDQAQNDTLKFGINGKYEISDVSREGTGNNNDNYNVARGARVAFNQYASIGAAAYRGRALKGNIGEVIFYEGELSLEETERINSYLSLKYGVTLKMADYGGKFRYKFSDGMVIWDGQNGVFEKNYHNNVAAIGRDDNSDFYNTQAHSTEFNSMLHVGVAGTSLSKDGKSNLGSFDYDKEVVVWGHDGSTGFKSVPQDDCYKFSNVFKRTWIMKKTTNGNRSIPLMVALQDNRSSASSSEMFEMYDLLLPQNEFFMLIADSPGDIAQNIFKEAIPMKYLNGELQCAYTFTNEITYVTFAFNQNIFPCVNSTDKEFKGKKTFDWSQWTRTNNNLNGAGSKTLSKPAKDLNDNIQVVATKIVYDNQVKANNTFPRVVTSPYNGIEIERLGGILNASKVTVTIEFNHPVLPEFFISGLDEWYEQRDRVSITGQCGNVLDDIRPVLSYANARSAGFTISGKTATVNRNGWRSDTDNNGKLNVVFEKPVKTVIIEYTITGKINTFAPQRIFISPFSLSSPKVPAPAPVINEDGLSFTKQVKEKNITTCDEVEYSFYITNTNFTNKFVNFRDVLPDGLTWKGESLGLDTVNAKNMFDGNHLFINPNYGGNRTLIIDSLQIPCTSTVRITATALINGNTVPVGGSRDFSNRAQIEYDRLSNNGQNSVHCLLKSSDRETLDSLTIFNAEWVLVESNLILSQPVINHDSYGPGEEIAVSLTIENKNAATISEMYLNLGFDAGFTFKESSGVTAVNSNGGVVGEVVMTAMDISDPYRTIAGSADGLSGFMLPPGVTTFTFTLVAPQPANLIYETDNQGNPTSRVVPLTTVYRYSTTDYGNFCLAKSINKLTGNFQVSYFSVVIKEIVPSIGPNTGGVYTGSSTTGAPYGIDTNGLVTIKGKGFQNGASSTIIKFGNLNSTNVTVVNDSIITCTPPAVNLSTVWNGQHNTTWNEGWVDVEIFFDAVSNGHLFAKKYFYRAPMTITGVSPDKAPVNGNTQITITGHNFLPPPSYNTGIPMPFEVLFGANPVDTMSVSNDQIVVKTKAHPVKYVDITTDNSIEKYITTGKPFAFYPTVFIKPGKWNEYDKWEDYLSDNILPPAHSVVHIKANCEQNIDVDMDSITVHPSISFTIGAGRMTRANVFSLLDNASFLNNGTDDIGQARVLHNLEKGRNWYVSSPVQGGNTMPDVDRSLGKDAQGQALTSYRVQYYNEPQAYIWHNATGTFETGRGYTAYSENEDIAACFTGKFTNGNQIAPVLQRTNNSAPKQGFNLVGNPFPSYWQWTSATASAANVYSTIWYRTKKAEYEFWTYNASGNISVAPGWEDEIIDVSLVAYIPPMQAFWVRLKDGQSTGTLTFSNSDRSHASNKKNILKAQGVGNHDERPLLRLAVTGDTNTDETVIYADPKAKYGFDTYDSDKMFTNTGVEIFTLPLTSLDKSGLLEHNKLVINGLHAIEGGMEIPIGFQTYQSGIFSFHAKKIQNLDTLGVFLRDRLRGVEFDLCNGGKYDFSAGSTPVTDRFSIVFRSFSATHLTDVEAGDRFLAYTDKEGRIIVSLHSQNAHGGRINISVSDVTGRKLTEQPVTVGEKTILKGVFKKGIYILHTGKWTTKVIVNSNR
ncbi:MAG: IPT/TIG domain-containing protein, partial [Dysgonamonadaceae bacterium]|nr:IPT/TIG domain-containing protein [Dysgonamonadaceae bacterium]